MNDAAINIRSLGKMYKLFHRQADKVLDAFGINRWLFWRKKYYQEYWALRDLNLEVKKGERLGIVGRNGAGKSTLLKIVSGIIAPTEGYLQVNGRVQALMELGTGFHPEFTGRENIRASLSYQGISSAKIREKEEEIIDFAELGDYIDQPLKTFSAGMSARLSFSTATSIEPEILIIDEILGAGDAYFAGKSLERMRRITEDTGATVLFVSHDLSSVQQICTRVIWIDRGQISAQGSPLEVTKAYYASILLQEERRLKTRNTQIMRQQNKFNIQNDAQEEHKLLGRLVVTRNIGLQQRVHPIRRLTLTDDDQLHLVLQLGAPMDNDRSQSTHILIDPHYTSWGEPRICFNNRVRCIENNGSEYDHAPFGFIVPDVQWEKGNLRLEIEHAVQSDEVVQVQVYSLEEYHTIGTLLPSPDGWFVQSWKLPEFVYKGKIIEPGETNPAINPAANDGNIYEYEIPPSNDLDDSKVILRQKNVTQFYSDYADLLNVEITDKHQHPRVIFGMNEEVTISVKALIRKDIPVSEFALTIYSMNAVVVSNLCWPFPDGLRTGVQKWTISIPIPNLRQGEYLISCGVIKEFLTASNEVVVFYCRWSRALSFRVEEEYIGNMPLGMVLMQTEPPIGSPILISHEQNQNNG